MPRVVVAIHQPNFFPWLGYFDKVARSDIFIVLDDAQFQKSGAGTWSNRVRLLVNHEPAWVTMPVKREYHGVRQVREMEIDSGQRWREKLLRTIRTHYATAAAFADVYSFVERLVINPVTSLAEYNTSAILELCGALSIDTGRFVKSSTLGIDAVATDRLIGLVKAVGGTAYLTGGGAEGYQEDDKFERAGIELLRQNFTHPTYPQGPHREFVAGLSCLDALLHSGFGGAASLVCP